MYVQFCTRDAHNQHDFPFIGTIRILNYDLQVCTTTVRTVHLDHHQNLTLIPPRPRPFSPVRPLNPPHPTHPTPIYFHSSSIMLFIYPGTRNTKGETETID